METITAPANKRSYVATDLRISSWNDIKKYYDDLKQRTISNLEDLKKWMKDRSELEAVIAEDLGWRYIKMTCDANNEKLVDSYNYFISEIDPFIAPETNELNKKLAACPYINELDKEVYFVYLRSVKKQLEIFRPENVKLASEISTLSQKYGAAVSELTVEVNGKELTLQQAAKFFHDNDRDLREQVFNKIKAARLSKKEEFNNLFSELIQLRHKVAINAGFENYRDYMFAELGRFDYTPKDCFDFHESIRSEILPVLNSFDAQRKKELGYDKLRPWDLDVETSGKTPLKPFTDQKDLIDKSIACFQLVKPEFAAYLKTMNEMKHLDLDSRKGKAPGGYNYPLYETGVPFIFMNAVGTMSDVETMVHEGGHAVHSFLSRELEITDFKSVPSEVAELASMSMELISMEHWNAFFDNEDDLKRAKIEQLEGRALRTLNWIAIVDKFQHWVYLNPSHTAEERNHHWTAIYKEYGSAVVSWEGHEDYLANLWQKQLHLFEVPFYYIEYGMAQLGAIAMWRNYKKDPEKTLEQYKYALSLGYTKTIPQLYEAAGIKFDFSQAYVKELAKFIKDELDKIG